MDARSRLFGEIYLGFTAELRGLLTGLFAKAVGSRAVLPTSLDPTDAANICLALVTGLKAVPEGGRLLGPAADAMPAGLLGNAADESALVG